MPVGLFGEQRKTTSGACSRTTSAACSGSSRNPGSRGTGSHAVPVPCEMSWCMEYVGSKPERRAAGATERLQQLLQHLVGAVGRPDLSVVSGWPVVPGEVGREVGAQRVGVPVRVAVHQPRRLPHRGGELGDQPG